MKRSLILLFIAVNFISCREIIKQTINSAQNSNSSNNLSDSDYKKVSVDTIYELSIPKYMKSMKNLNDEASLQYANIYKEVYTIVIHENKQDFIDTFKELDEYNDSLSVIENYQNVQENFFEETANSYKVEHYGLTKINGYNARQLKFNGKVEGYNISYVIAFVEGVENVFMIMNWTLLDRKNKYENIFESINSSFKLIE